MKLQPYLLSLAALATLLTSSCQYAGDRALDLLDPYRVAVGAGTVVGARSTSLGLYDTGLMLGVKPKVSSLGWRYGRPLFFDQSDERVDADQAEIIKTTSVIDLDTGDGSYRSARNSFALLPGILTWADSTPTDIDWYVPEAGGEYDDRIWLWSAESFSRNRYAQIHAFDIELELAIGIYVDVGFSPGEVIDFLLGFVLIDIAADDDRFEDAYDENHSLLFAALVLLSSACAVPDPDPGFTPAWEPFDPTEEGWETTREILLISDCQLHNLYSQPVPDRNQSAKAAIATAIRSPQLDLFAEDVLSYILRNGAPEAELVLHLGDALDLACEGEWERFERVMGEAGKPWFMAPGNHDAYYFGNYDPENPQRWQEACYSSGRRLTKDLYIRLYVGSLLRQQIAGIDGLAESLGLQDARTESSASLGERLPLEYEWHAPLDGPGFLDSIAWRIDEERPWRSYIIQAIDVTAEEAEALDVRILLMDSCQYSRRPEMVPNGWMIYPVSLNAGRAGEMLPDQLRMARSWLDRDPAIGYSFACHHPYSGLAPRAKASLGWLWREHRASSLLSAHTHAGYYEHHDLGEGVERLELNIGSTTDWPMEWRTFTGYYNPEQSAGFLRSRRHTLVDELSHQEGYFLRGWEVPLGAPDDYRSYKQGEAETRMFFNYYFVFHVVPYWLPQPKLWVGQGARDTEESVKDTLLLTYQRLIDWFPTDPGAEGTEWPEGCYDDADIVGRIGALMEREDAFLDKIAFLVELDRWEHSRSSRDPESGESTDDERLRFKVCQAAWASRYENAQGRRLSVEDELIRVTRRLKVDEVEP